MKIEKNIPISEPRESKYSIVEQMVVGDSILCKNRNEAVALQIQGRYKNPSWKFSTRTMENKTVRVWRVK